MGKVKFLGDIPSLIITNDTVQNSKQMPQSLIDGSFRFYIPDLKKIAEKIELNPNKNKKQGIIIVAGKDRFELLELWPDSGYSWSKTFDSMALLNFYLLEIICSQLIYHISDINSSYSKVLKWNSLFKGNDHIGFKESLFEKKMIALASLKETIRLRPSFEIIYKNMFKQSDLSIKNFLIHRSQLNEPELSAGRPGERQFVSPIAKENISAEYQRIKAENKKQQIDRKSDFEQKFYEGEKKVLSDLVNLKMAYEKSSSIFGTNEVVVY